MISQCGFDLHFPVARLSNFSCAYWPSACLLWKNVYSAALPIFKNWIVWGFFVKLYEFFTYFGYQSLIEYMICKHFLLIGRLSILLMFSFAVKHRFSLI